MKRIIYAISFLALLSSCSSPYWNPVVSKAVSEEKQIELLERQNTLLENQNKQLTRIADVLSASQLPESQPTCRRIEPKLYH